jgi:hypothetical protein
MKTSTRYTLIVLGLLIHTALSLQSCTQAAEAYTALKTNNIEAVNSAISTTNGTELTDDEIASLVYMREEEKLAHDVYLTLYDLYGLPIFKNIARSEQTHTEAVKQLLDVFDIPDPADTSPAGVFVDPELQNLYDELIQTGSQSLGDALKVGAVIEEIDILDLEENLDFAENENIRNVFINLIRGSENHLRAFTKTLARNTGETYQPQFMDVDAYNEIVSSTSAIPQRLNQQVDQMTNNRGGRNRR